MFKNKSIILQVDESTKRLMDEIKGRISEDILEDLGEIKNDISESSSSLGSIKERIKKLDGICDNLDGIEKVKEQTAQIYNILDSEQAQDPGLKKPVLADILEAKQSILNRVDEHQQSSDELKDVFNLFKDSYDKFSTEVTAWKTILDKISETVDNNQQLSREAKELLSYIKEKTDCIGESMTTLLEILNKLQTADGERNSKIDNLLSQQSECRMLHLRTLYHSTPFWRFKERRAIKNLMR